jgi:hypothetical protein
MTDPRAAPVRPAHAPECANQAGHSSSSIATAMASTTTTTDAGAARRQSARDGQAAVSKAPQIQACRASQTPGAEVATKIAIHHRARGIRSSGARPTHIARTCPARKRTSPKCHPVAVRRGTIDGKAGSPPSSHATMKWAVSCARVPGSAAKAKHHRPARPDSRIAAVATATARTSRKAKALSQ